MAKTKKRAELENALLQVYEQSYDRVARYLFSRIGNQHEAEDLASDTFMKALEALDSYHDRGLPMEVWIFKIAHNLYVDYIRKENKRKNVNIDRIVIAVAPEAEAIAEMNDDIEQLSNAMEHLTPNQKEVIALRFYSGLKSSECAQVLGKNHGAVREMQSAALRTLRQVLVSGHE